MASDECYITVKMRICDEQGCANCQYYTGTPCKLDAVMTVKDNSKQIIEAQQERISELVQMLAEKGSPQMEWHEGRPPEFGKDRVWIVAEIPSLFINGAYSYKTFVWGGYGYGDKTVCRATRWAILPLPELPEKGAER